MYTYMCVCVCVCVCANGLMEKMERNMFLFPFIKHYIFNYCLLKLICE